VTDVCFWFLCSATCNMLSCLHAVLGSRLWEDGCDRVKFWVFCVFALPLLLQCILFCVKLTVQLCVLLQSCVCLYGDRLFYLCITVVLFIFCYDCEWRSTMRRNGCGGVRVREGPHRLRRMPTPRGWLIRKSFRVCYIFFSCD
jgi:hypothetical protein